MGLFSSRPKWQSLPADEIAEQIIELHNSGKQKEARDMATQIKHGKVPGITSKEQKEMDKLYKRVTEGEKGAKAALASLRELKKASGNQGYKNRPLKERVHPSEFKHQVRSGKYQPTAQEAADIKKSDPALYQQLLQAEAKRRGLL